ncbi:MAG: helix-turn-helix transcriptional regulator [Bacteroidales bacterium]|nr:helix-turn-helix transcriptional regulator [Bacteroidales bacterium]
MKAKYIDPELKDFINGIPKPIEKEVGYSFDIAKRILDVLHKKGWSRSDLAKATGKRESEITRWLSGTHNYTIRTIALIESALGEEIISVKRYRRSQS